MNKTLAGIASSFALILNVALAGGERIESKDSKMMTQPILEQNCNWTGFYIGANVGYAGGDFKWSDIIEGGGGAAAGEGANEVLVDERQSGFIGGGQLGYNYQWRNWVVGVEGEISYSDVDTNRFVPGEMDSNLFEIRSHWQASAALRLGYSYKKWLFYARGGAGFVQQSYAQTHAVSAGIDAEGGPAENAHVDSFKADEVRTAPLAGGGIEYAINCHWSVKLEYNHIFLGGDDVSGTAIDDGVKEPETFRFSNMDQDSVRLGVNYKF